MDAYSSHTAIYIAKLFKTQPRRPSWGMTHRQLARFASGLKNRGLIPSRPVSSPVRATGEKRNGDCIDVIPVLGNSTLAEIGHWAQIMGERGVFSWLVTSARRLETNEFPLPEIALLKGHGVSVIQNSLQGEDLAELSASPLRDNLKRIRAIFDEHLPYAVDTLFAADPGGSMPGNRLLAEEGLASGFNTQIYPAPVGEDLKRGLSSHIRLIDCFAARTTTDTEHLLSAIEQDNWRLRKLSIEQRLYAGFDRIKNYFSVLE